MFRAKSVLLCVVIVVWSLFLSPAEVKAREATRAQYKPLSSWGGPGKADGKFNKPCGIAVDAKENVYVVDSGNKRIQKLTTDGKFITKWTTSNTPRAIAIDASGDVYVAEAGKDSGLIEKFTSDGKLIKKWQYKGRSYTTRSGKERSSAMPGGIAVSEKYVYLGNNSTGAIDKFTKDGEFVKSWGKLRRCCGFLDVAVDKQEKVYVAELGAHSVHVFDSNGKSLGKWGKKGKGTGEFCGCCNPVHLVMGPDDMIITSSKTIPRIQVFTKKGKHISTFAVKELSKACGFMDLAVSSSGKIYVVDDAASSIRVYSKDPKDSETK